MKEQPGHIVFFDGLCNLCNAWVKFIIKRDPLGRFFYASLQSDFAKSFLEGEVSNPAQNQSVIYAKKGMLYFKSDAALHILVDLGWNWVKVFFIFPRGFRNWVYDLIAKNRYRWFGKKDHCEVPKPEWKKRFLGS